MVGFWPVQSRMNFEIDGVGLLCSAVSKISKSENTGMDLKKPLLDRHNLTPALY